MRHFYDVNRVRGLALIKGAQALKNKYRGLIFLSGPFQWNKSHLPLGSPSQNPGLSAPPTDHELAAQEILSNWFGPIEKGEE